ncbi:Rrf2 family transcriptional regulator [Peptococcaceae bacterium]|nr:Rrf2 family transcriptional regulator [Peptococcaceae bacterium]
MKLSTKGRYGLKAMFDLALHYGDIPIPLKVVAERQCVSENYLEQLIAVLRKAGMVNSVRGAQGGYVLAKKPEQITVGDIIRVMEGSIAPLDCVKEGEAVDCIQFEHCVSRNVWLRVRDSITDVLDTTTLADMCREAEGLKNKEQGIRKTLEP